MKTAESKTTYLQDIWIYASRVKFFSRTDWVVYALWVGMMYGLFAVVTGFLLAGHQAGAVFPAYVWNIPIGIFIFSTSIAFDTIGHRTVYKEYLERMEALVHHVTIFFGISSVMLLCLAYHFPVFLRIPCLVLIFMSVLYSMIDEAMHWIRYATQNSDRVEMWSHAGIFTGHLIMVIAWWKWFDEGYLGVDATVAALKNLGIL
jgi:hypothetical protein